MFVTAEHTGSFKSDVVQIGAFRDMAPLDEPQTSNVITREVLDAQAYHQLVRTLAQRGQRYTLVVKRLDLRQHRHSWYSGRKSG